MECTGFFTKRADAEKHLAAGAKRVLISAPATDEDITVVYGVNENRLRKSHKVVSNASCTTNCLAPVAAVLDKAVGVSKGYMTTVHAYTGDQRILDTLHSDLRRARAAGQSLIPTSTGAAKAVGRVLPELDGKLDGTAIRVPTQNVSMIDFKFVASRKTTAEEINAAIEKAAKTRRLKGVLATNDAPLVSTDFNHNAASSVFDLTQTQGDRRHAGPCAQLVRQRVGLLQPDDRRRGGARPARLTRRGRCRGRSAPSRSPESGCCCAPISTFR